MHAMSLPPYASLGSFKIDTSKSHFHKALGFITSWLLSMWELFLPVLANLFAKTTLAHKIGPLLPNVLFDSSYCLSWRVAVETNNAGPWGTVPAQCVLYVGRYMLGGQYNRDLETVMEMIGTYLDGMEAGDDGMDAWILDVDDTCLSNLLYYQGKQFGGMPFDPTAFKLWAGKGMCSAILPVLELFNKLIERGYKVFLLTGRDESTFRAITTANLHDQGYVGYERLIMRGMPFDPAAFKLWAGKGLCSAILPVLELFNKLIERGYKVFLLIGRDESTFRAITTANLHDQGYVGYERLIMRGMPFDPAAFKLWAGKGLCSAILPVLELFNKLIEQGYKVFLLTGRDESTFRAITTANLHDQGYVGYERLIMRTADYKGKGAKIFKSAIRKQLIDEGYKIRGNVGDQWSDLQGEYLADRSFKLPNPMYCVP